MQIHDGKTAVAIIGSGNIGTDLMVKILRHGKHLKMGAFVGIDPESDGLKRAERMGVPTVSTGIEGLLSHPDFGSIGFVFDATSAGAHARHEQLLRPHGVRVIDLTPAAIGPFVVPAVNIEQHLDAPNVNMVTCGGQATIPMVAAVSRVVPVEYAEIVASISSRSAGPGTRANIDEFTETTSNAIVRVGGPAWQGNHHPQSGRTSADHARHRLLSGAGPSGSAGYRRVGRAHGFRGGGIRAWLPAQADRAVR